MHVVIVNRTNTGIADKTVSTKALEQEVRYRLKAIQVEFCFSTRWMTKDGGEFDD